MEEIINFNENIFENIKHIDENGYEYWNARELQKILEYRGWKNFEKVIDKAKTSCQKSKLDIYDHFIQLGEIIYTSSEKRRKMIDYKLSRYACYLIVQNADSRKKAVALAQTYITIQTRKQEVLESENLSDLATKIFILSQVEQKIKNEKIIGEDNLRKAYNEVSKVVKEMKEELSCLDFENTSTSNKNTK